MKKFSISAGIHAPAERVFAIVKNPALIPQWRTDVPEIFNIKGTGEAGTTFTEKVNFMGSKNLEMKVTEFEANRKIVISGERGMAILPTQSFSFVSKGNSTQVTLEVTIRTTGFFRIMEGLFPSMFKKIWAKYLVRLDELARGKE